jgi:5,10-methylene-tetrahydrofolate dehydrogenase/methenyl tetrahydrofolate cyclohydrolase
VNGILVQLPLPDHIDEEAVLNTIALEKDVDGFHPVNIGRLAMKGRDPLFIPCTPNGCIRLLEESGIEMSGAEAVVVGRSNIVGLPVAMLLQKANATVTICHSRTKDLAEHTRNADIVIAAIGRTEMITGDMLKPGCAVIDVGINQKPDETKKRGYRLVGDVEYDTAQEVAGAITPVPGGVGPMTIAMLMANTLRAAEIQQGQS